MYRHSSIKLTGKAGLKESGNNWLTLHEKSVESSPLSRQTCLGF